MMKFTLGWNAARFEFGPQSLIGQVNLKGACRYERIFDGISLKIIFFEIKQNILPIKNAIIQA